MRAARAPSIARQINDAPATKTDIWLWGATVIVRMGRTAPTAKAAADATAACKGRVTTFSEIPNSSRVCAASASCAVNCFRHRPRKNRLDATSDINAGQFLNLSFRIRRQLTTFDFDVGTFGIGLGTDGYVLPGCHGERSGRQPGNAGHQDVIPSRVRSGDANDETGRRHDSIIGAEHRRAEPADSSRSMPLSASHRQQP